MRYAGLALAAFLLVSQPICTLSEDHAKIYVVGTYLGYEMQPDSTDGASSSLHRTYYLRTEDGTWSLVSFGGAGEVLEHTIGWSPVHQKNDRQNLLDSMKHGERLAFRIEADRRMGAVKPTFHVYIPQADDPKKEDKFDAELTPIPAHEAAPAPTDNVKAMCDAHRFTPDQEKQYCGNQ
jgi:hypothetical protein